MNYKDSRSTSGREQRVTSSMSGDKSTSTMSTAGLMALPTDRALPERSGNDWHLHLLPVRSKKGIFLGEELTHRMDEAEDQYSVGTLEGLHGGQTQPSRVMGEFGRSHGMKPWAQTRAPWPRASSRPASSSSVTSSFYTKSRNASFRTTTAGRASRRPDGLDDSIVMPSQRRLPPRFLR